MGLARAGFRSLRAVTPGLLDSPHALTHLLPLAQVSFYARFCPGELEAGCTPGSTLLASLSHLGRQAGKLNPSCIPGCRPPRKPVQQRSVPSSCR